MGRIAVATHHLTLLNSGDTGSVQGEPNYDRLNLTLFMGLNAIFLLCWISEFVCLSPKFEGGRNL